MSKRRKAEKPQYTIAEINSFLNRRVGHRSYVRDTVENTWIAAMRATAALAAGSGSSPVTACGAAWSSTRWR